MRLMLVFLCILMLLTVVVQAEAPVFHTNPAPIKDIGDPFILHAEGAYWHFSTTGGIAFSARRSEDLETWGKPVWAYVPGKDSWGVKDFWAPEVYEVDGAYYLFYSARWKENDSLRIGVARADRPEGPYTDITQGPLFDFGYAAIDAHVLFGEGQAYLYYARDCSENVVDGRHESHLYGIRLAPALDAVEGEPVQLTRPDQPWEMASGPEWLWNEGAYVLKDGGKYWLFYSANFYAGKEYGVGAAWAEHPLGPYTKLAQNPLLSYVEHDGEVLLSGPGHNSFFTVGDELYTAYHTHVVPKNPSGYRQTAFDRVGFTAQGMPYINGPTTTSQLPPLALHGLTNHLAQAVPDDEGSALLMDGDQGMGSADKEGRYAQQTRYGWTWEEPVALKHLALYAHSEVPVQGRFVLGDKSEPFTLEPGDGALGVHWSSGLDGAVTRLELVWEGEPPRAFELMAVGE